MLILAPCVNAPVHVVHYVQPRGNVLVKVWLRMVLRHVVQEVDVRERPAGEFLCVWPNLEFVMVILI